MEERGSYRRWLWIGRVKNGDSMALGAAEKEFHAGDGAHVTLSSPSSLGGTSPSGMLPGPRAWSQGCGRFQACESQAPRRENLKLVLE